jgi:hypothetical protein
MENAYSANSQSPVTSAFLKAAVIAAGVFAVMLPTRADPARDFVQAASGEYGNAGQQAATFLVENMPEGDRQTLSADFLTANLRLAMKARTEFPWARNLPDDLFFNDVLPYAVLDETREPWREKMLSLAGPLVEGCANASEAARTLNRQLFNALGVHYDTRRQRPNQSPSESIAQGRATCTGLAILLIDACRAVGIPARAAGVAAWTNKPGNHTWVEIWDGRWKFLGADESDPRGLDRGWFAADAAKAVATEPSHAVWASSWKSVDGHFPLAWNPQNAAVGAVNVTARYAANAPAAPLTKAQADAALQDAWKNLPLEQRKQDLAAKAFSLDGKTIHWAEHVHGAKPAGGYSLWISLHGGGNAPAELNDEQFRNQILLYNPDEGIWVVPRAPTNTWNLWHEPHIDPMFDRIIEDYIALRGVNPNRVYLLGYSAGGDGVYQLAPRMADRFAAASMMAGHPNEASPLGLRNLPFAIFVGGADAGYHRNEVAQEWGDRLDALQKADPGGYRHWLRIYEGLGHWMKRRDAEALPWMAKFVRDPWPKRVVWYQDDVTHNRFYWLAVQKGTAKPGQTITAEADGQTIRISAKDRHQLELRLSDQLVDLDQPVTVIVNGRRIFHGFVPRTRDAIETSLRERADADSAATATLRLDW